MFIVQSVGNFRSANRFRMNRGSSHRSVFRVTFFVDTFQEIADI